MTESAVMRLWGRGNSTNVKKVRWCARECGFELEQFDVGGRYGGLDNPEFLAKNPYGEIPVLEHAGLVYRESNAIVRYLCALYGEPFYSQSPAARARADVWMDWSSCSLMPWYKTIFLGLVRTAAADRDHVAIDRACEQTLALLQPVDLHLREQRYLSGDDFGMGDIPLGCMIYGLVELKLVTQLSNVRRWYERLLARPAYVETVCLPLT
jgi:glutathione S-transferase